MSTNNQTSSQKAYQWAKEKGLVSEKDNYIKFKDSKTQKSTGEHIIKFLDDQPIDGTNFRTRKPEKKIRYSFEENNIKKIYEPAILVSVKDGSGKIEKNDDGSDKMKLNNFVEQMQEFEHGDIIRANYTPLAGTFGGFTKLDKMNMNEGEEEEIEEGEDGEEDMEEEEKPEPKKMVPTKEGGDIDVSEIPF